MVRRARPIVKAPDREQVLDQVVAAWAKDLAQGRETAMLAWRRANVTALNARARVAMAEAGQLSGPGLQGAAPPIRPGT